MIYIDKYCLGADICVMKQKQEYLLDIPLACSVALEGGLKKYRNILQPLPDNSLEFIEDWNSSLISVLRYPKFKKYLGAFGRSIVMLRNPRLVAWGVDKVSVPYRSFYYASRFTESLNFATNKAQEFQNLNINKNTSPIVVDFGHGLSPWSPLLNENLDFITTYMADKGLVHDVYEKTMDIMKLQSRPKNINMERINLIPSFQKLVFVSLGTFVYLPKEERTKILKDIVSKFRYFYVGLELDKAQKDGKIVENMGVAYQKGWNVLELQKVIGTEISIKTLLDDSVYYKEFKNLENSLRAATEFFIQR